ncbi:MAG: sigma-54-dependent transcriptional regulator [Pyrinomonadaceae bacterium]
MTKSLHALVIDDEPQIVSFMAEVLEREGWNVSQANSSEEALKKLAEKTWSIVFCDVVLGGPDGYSVLREFTETQPDVPFILMTGRGSAAGALDATSTGAYDYLLKPFGVDDILRISSLVKEQLKSRKKYAGSALKDKERAYESDLSLIGTSPKFVECLKLVGRVAGTHLPVLITGESGTGKEIVARAIHQRSKRSAHRFVTVNCGAIPTELIESELFGHARGSFTGADRERMGLWEEATGGTLFLDEITETNLLFQVKLLRALQEGEIRRVGSNRTVKVDVRVIAASNRDIEIEVEKGNFRQDLMYRLNAVTIDLPPLRERREDILLLAEHFVREIAFEDNPPRFADETLKILQGYDWPGNIRELENAVLHAVSLSDGIIYPEHLPTRIRFSGAADRRSTPRAAPEGHVGHHQPGTEWRQLAEMEQEYVREVLAHTSGNKQAASRILNIDRKTLSRILDRKLPGK